MSVELKFLTSQEFATIEEQRREGYPDNCDMHDFFLPGYAWFNPWYFNPDDPRESTDYDASSVSNRKEELIAWHKRKGSEGKSFLSVPYWRDWSHIRPPITVVCPNGEQWCIDQKSSNGPGWVVTGLWDDGLHILRNITVTPSIVVSGYHGWMRDSKFSADIEGRGLNGVFIPYNVRF